MAGVSSDRLITCTACRDSCVAYVATHDSGPPGGIRTFDLLIQSLCLGISLANRVLSVRRASVGRRIGMSLVPIPK
jgi:hypothetical protein